MLGRFYSVAAHQWHAEISSAAFIRPGRVLKHILLRLYRKQPPARPFFAALLCRENNAARVDISPRHRNGVATRRDI